MTIGRLIAAQGPAVIWALSAGAVLAILLFLAGWIVCHLVNWRRMELMAEAHAGALFREERLAREAAELEAKHWRERYETAELGLRVAEVRMSRLAEISPHEAAQVVLISGNGSVHQ